MATRNISLTEHFDRFIDESIASGDYSNASEVVRDALRLLEERKREHELKLKRLREAAAVGFAEIDRGEYLELKPDEIDAYVSSMRRRVSARRRKRAS